MQDLREVSVNIALLKSRDGANQLSYFSPIKSETDATSQAGKTILKLGIFEKIPHPEFESFVKDRQPWIKQFEGTTQFKVKFGGEKVE